MLQIFTTPSTPLHAILDPSPEKRVFATAAVWLHSVSCATISNLNGAGFASVEVSALSEPDDPSEDVREVVVGCEGVGVAGGETGVVVAGELGEEVY